MNVFAAGEGKIPFVFFLFFFFLASFSLSAATLEIIRPLSGTMLDVSEISIVVKVNDPSVSKIIFTDTKGHVTVREIVKGKEVYCQSLSAEMGENHISVSAYHGTEKVADSSVSVYYRSEIFSEFQEAPSGYKKIAFHTDKDEQLCKTCHKIITGASQYVVHDNPEDSSCYRCHKNLVNRAKGHAPSINWMCTECHTGKGGEYGEESGDKSKYTAPDPIMERCFSCHENTKKLWFSRKSEHGPVRDGRCNRCHNPHASNELFFLRKPIWDLCTTCHAEKASGAHVISSYVRDKSHPMKGKPDPSRPGRELACSGCHDPHGSDGIFLLRSKGKTAFSICIRCHKK
jgi:predicted CXXCH cytochrome family protein